MQTFYSSLVDLEEMQRSACEVAKELGGTEGYIGEVVLGPAIVEARPPGTRVVTVMTGPGRYVHPPAAPPPRPPVPPPGPLEAAILDAIHGHVIQALARLPRAAAREHARGVVLAGHCYGCIRDPASNVLANAIWHDVAFPPGDQRPTDMVGAAALYRCARRSLDGLVAFMRSYCPDVPTEQVLQCLAASGADLGAAVRMATGGEETLFLAASPCARDAFERAATAARHPDPAAYARFSETLMGHKPEAVTVHSVLMLACSTGTLSPAAVDAVTAALRHLIHTPSPHTAPQPMSRGAQRAVSHTTNAFMERQVHMAAAIVELALQKHAMQTGELLSLHFICGATRFWPGSRDIFHHINFLATRRNAAAQFVFPGRDEAPALFFAEINALARAASDVTLCCRVPTSQGPGGCEACEFVGGRRLVHPAGEEFHGRVIQFKPREECLKKHPDDEIAVPLDEDYVFFDAGLHPEMTRFLENRYSAMDDDHVDLSFFRFG